jgi:hypothetical protein
MAGTTVAGRTRAARPAEVPPRFGLLQLLQPCACHRSVGRAVELANEVLQYGLAGRTLDDSPSSRRCFVLWRRLRGRGWPRWRCRCRSVDDRNRISAQRAIDKWLLPALGCGPYLITHPAERNADVEAGRRQMFEQGGSERAVVAGPVVGRRALLRGERNQCVRRGRVDSHEAAAHRAGLRRMAPMNGLLRQASRMTSRRRLAGSMACNTRSSATVSSTTSKSRASLASTGTR